MTALDRVMLTTGGTGGHIFPALAVAEELRLRHPASHILFVGSTRGPEGDMARGAGLEFTGLPVEGVFGRGLRALRAFIKLKWSILKAWALVGRFKPQVVIGFGGYASFASVAAAWLRRVPTALHEQNSVPGMSNKMLGRLVRRVFLTFPDEMGVFDAKKTVLTGLPVRQAIQALGREGSAHAGTRRLLVLGGSQGAKAVNTAVLGMLGWLDEQSVEVRHQAGKLDYERVRQGYEEQGRDTSMVTAFISDMAEAYKWADLVLCRAGASTVAELAVAGKPCIFVPFPHATHGHQLANARALERAGGALVVEQKDVEPAPLGARILEILTDPERRERMGRAAKAWAMPDAAAGIVIEIEKLAAAQGVDNRARTARP